MKQQVMDSMHKVKDEINYVEHEAICARQVLNQRLERFEIARTSSSADLTKEFVKWQDIHKVFEDYLVSEDHLVTME